MLVLDVINILHAGYDSLFLFNNIFNTCVLQHFYFLYKFQYFFTIIMSLAVYRNESMQMMLEHLSEYGIPVPVYNSQMRQQGFFMFSGLQITS